MNSPIMVSLLQILIIIVTSLMINLVQRVLHDKIKFKYTYYDLWPILTLYYGLINLKWGLFPFVVIGWMAIGILVVCMQLIHNHELIYKKFFFVFWRITVVYTTMAYVISLIYLNLG